jgi:hypothetical protein
METIYVNWEDDWNNCFTIWPKSSKIKWCSRHQMYHDIKCFLGYKNSAPKCFMGASSRPWKGQK